MKAIVLLLLAILVGCATTSTYVSERVVQKSAVTFLIGQTDDPLSIGPIIAEEIEKRGYSVERVDVKYFRPESRSQEIANGSGFLVSSDGYVLTNSHVIGKSEDIVVKYRGKEFAATVLENDTNNDIALLKIDNGEFENYLPLSSSSSVRTGDPVLVVGYPLAALLGDEPRVSDGIVSAKTGIAANPTRLQITASIQPGNSGGPILDQEYRVIGIATEKLSDEKAYQESGSIPQNVNFGVKIEYASMLIDPYSIRRGEAPHAGLENAIAGTVQVIAGPKNDEPIGRKYVSVEYQYRYTWDVIHYMLSSLIVKCIDIENGQVVCQGTHTGGTFDGYKQTTKKVMQEMLDALDR